jgi:cytochrome c556
LKEREGELSVAIQRDAPCSVIENTRETSFMKRLTLAAASLAIAATAAFAQVADEREDIMEERRDILRILGPIAQGQAPFDAAVVLAALEDMNANAQRHDADALYPADSLGGDSEASPEIAERFDEFKAIDDKYKADVAAALAAAPADIDAFRAVFGPATSSCGTCHETFRLD